MAVTNPTISFPTVSKHISTMLQPTQHANLSGTRSLLLGEQLIDCFAIQPPIIVTQHMVYLSTPKKKKIKQTNKTLVENNLKTLEWVEEGALSWAKDEEVTYLRRL